MPSLAAILPILAVLGSVAASPIDLGGNHGRHHHDDDALCIIYDVRYTNPWYTRHQYKKGHMQCPDGIDSFLFLSLLDKCCEDYDRHHPGHHGCDDDNCDDDDDNKGCHDDDCEWHRGHGGKCDESGCHGGHGWNDNEGVCIISETRITDPMWTRKQYKHGKYHCPEGIDTKLFIKTLDECCDEYEREHRGHHGHGRKGDDDHCDDDDSDCDDSDDDDDSDDSDDDNDDNDSDDDCDSDDDDDSDDDCDEHDDDEDCDDESDDDECDDDDGGFLGLGDYGLDGLL